jgi:hypothetical protein
MNQRKRVLLITFLLALSVARGRAASETSRDESGTKDPADLASDFAAPPPAAKCWTYWYWMTPPTPEKITRDLEAMHEQGIQCVLTFAFNEYMKPGWLPLFEHLLKEAKRLNMTVGLDHDAGWSCSIPWLSPENAEKKLVFSRQTFEGSQRITQRMPAPAKGFYRDAAVLACLLPKEPAKDARYDDESEMRMKQAVVMPNSYPSGFLDNFYRKSSDTNGTEPLQPRNVVDISARMDSNGRLNWEAPAGRWMVLRFGYAVVNKEFPDFFNREALDQHFNQSIDKMLPTLGRYVGNPWTFMHQDSFECGAQTWTQTFREEFRKRRGYDMTPWMPTLAGNVVGSRELSDRFLHDYRCTISDLYVENWFGYFARKLHARGLAFSTEAGYGWASPIADGLRIEGFSDMPMGEAWHRQVHPLTGEPLEYQFKVHHFDRSDPLADRAIPYGTGLNTIRLAASAAHIYGKPFCAAETFTSYIKGGRDLCNPPSSIKTTADRAFCDGLGHVLYHCYPLQLAADEKPGVVWYDVGLQLSRNITWWRQLSAFNDYLSRCGLLLRQGKFVADFAYWTGDRMPYECPDRRALRPALPRGCNADIVNTDVLLNRMTVKNGRLTLPDGMSYRYLVLPATQGDAPSKIPRRETIDPASLRALKKLIEQGAAVVLGPRPESAAGLGNQPKCDEEVTALVNKIWGTTPSPRGERKLGLGRVVWGCELADLLKTDGLPLDVEIKTTTSKADFEWIHRQGGGRDIYFLSNQGDRDESCEVRFRNGSRQPVLWDPVWGTQRALPDYRMDNDVMTVPMHFAPRQSWFVVFDSSSPEEMGQAKTARPSNFPAARSVMDLSQAWEVRFDPKWGGPASVVFDILEDWTKRQEIGIHYYSGTATYCKSFDLPKEIAGQSGTSTLWLDLGTVKDLAEVRLNGKRLGVVWTAPWRVDITTAARSQGNELEIDLVNQWSNRRILDSGLPADQQLTKEVAATGKGSRPATPLTPNDPLEPSGLIGPVTLQVESGR